MSNARGNGFLGRLPTLVLVLTIASALAGCALWPFGGHSAPSNPKLKIQGQRVSVLSFDQPLQPDERLASTPVSLPAPASVTDWAQAGGNAQHSIGNVAAPGNLKRVWSVRV